MAWLKAPLKSLVVVLASVEGNDKIQLVAGVTPDLVNTVKAGEMLGRVAAQVGGKGGGKPDFAMAGGNDVAALEGVLGMTHERLVQQLANRK